MTTGSDTDYSGSLTEEQDRKTRTGGADGGVHTRTAICRPGAGATAARLQSGLVSDPVYNPLVASSPAETLRCYSSPRVETCGVSPIRVAVAHVQSETG